MIQERTDVESTSTQSQGQKPHWFASFVDLIPVAVLVVLVLFHLWTISIFATLFCALVSMGIHAKQKQKITSMEWILLVLGVISGVLYFGYHSTFLLQHVGIFIYTLLLLEVIVSLIRNEPWTKQHAKRSVQPEVWELPVFHETNRFLTYIWGAVFAVGVVLSFTPNMLIGIFVPVVLVIATAIATPRIVIWFVPWYLRRHM